MNRPRLWLAFFIVVYALLTVDLCRAPGSQLSGSAYVKVVGVYQRFGRPMLAGKVACRFSPSCSVYSIQAVETHGLVRGLVLTFDRLSRCTDDAPHGVIDPVP